MSDKHKRLPDEVVEWFIKGLGKRIDEVRENEQKAVLSNVLDQVRNNPCNVDMSDLPDYVYAKVKEQFPGLILDTPVCDVRRFALQESPPSKEEEDYSRKRLRVEEQNFSAEAMELAHEIEGYKTRVQDIMLKLDMEDEEEERDLLESSKRKLMAIITKKKALLKTLLTK